MSNNLEPVTALPKKWFWLLGILVLVTSAVSLLAFNHRHTGQLSKSPVCGRDVLDKAGSALRSHRDADLGTVVSAIMKLPRFDTDPNCLLVVLNYDVYRGDPKAGRLHLDQLNRVYEPSMGFDRAISSMAPGWEITTLNADVNYLEKVAAQSAKNVGEQRGVIK